MKSFNVAACIVTGFGLIVGIQAPSLHAQTNFVVHEWGTFTSVQGGDGELLPWRPLRTSDLPKFVYDWSKPGLNRFSSGMFVGKGQMITLQRMETPVIYFYSDDVMQADVSVAFPNGLITEWYPQATQIGPSVPGNTNEPSGALPESRAAWKHLLLTPANQQLKHRNVARQDRSGGHYYSAQRTAANTVQVIAPGQTDDIETERFVFYRGAGSFKTPLRVSVKTNSPIAIEKGAVFVENTGTENLSHLFLVTVHDGQGAFEKMDTLVPNKSTRWYALNPSEIDSHAWMRVPLEQFQSKISEQMEAALVSGGLFPLEAKAMVNTWKDSWFTEEGDRVLYVLPRAWTDETLPMTLNPKPEKLVRVMVGRAEIITPAAVQKLKEALTKATGEIEPHNLAVAELRKFGRFAEPALRLVNANGDTSLGYEFLSEAAQPGAEQLEQLYLAWQRECETILTSSITGDYIGLPSYRKMVAVGEPALPFLMRKMDGHKGMDFMLAFAAVEIKGWNKKDFLGGGEQSFRDRVLEKLQAQ